MVSLSLVKRCPEIVDVVGRRHVHLHTHAVRREQRKADGDVRNDVLDDVGYLREHGAHVERAGDHRQQALSVSRSIRRCCSSDHSRSCAMATASRCATCPSAMASSSLKAST